MCRTKICSKCNTEKQVTEFYAEKRTKDGFQSQCKECLNSAWRQKYRNNPEFREKERLRLKEWGKKNKEKVADSKRRHYENNKEARRQSVYSYVKRNPEKALESKRKWIDKNRGHVRAYNNSKHKRVKKQTPENADIAQIRAIYKSAQKLTQETGITYSVDHIIPLSKGGLHHQDNLRVITLSENCSKGSKCV
jgi:hypothetical protein